MAVMDIVKTLAPIARNACELEDSDPQSKGEFLRMLCICAELDENNSQLLFEHILDSLSSESLIESCEFHEGLGDILSTPRMVEVIVGVTSHESDDELSRILISLCDSGVLKLDGACWKFIRSNMTPSRFRLMLSRIIETTCDRTDQIYELLLMVFKEEEEFDIADTIRLVLESHWFMDIIPQKRKKARRVIEEFFLRPFPFAKQYIDTFLIETLRFEDVVQEPVQEPIPAIEAGNSSSSDSDIESRGSLDDFVVDDSVDESVASSVSEELLLNTRPRGKRHRRKYSTDSSDHSSSNNSCESSDS